jgi:hypothetical protein
MKKLSKILLSTLFLMIAGCSSTPNEMRADAREKGAVQVNLPFDLVRDNFIRQAKKCYSGGLRTAYYVHEEKYTKPNESTTFDIVLDGALRRIFLSSDIKKTGTGSTEITYWVSGLIVPKFEAAIESWAKGESGKCS